MLNTTLNGLTNAVRSIAAGWRQSKDEQTRRRQCLGRPTPELDRLMVDSALTPEFSDIVPKLGPNTRRMMDRVGVKLARPGPRQAALLGEIERTCKACPDWRRCTLWLECGKHDQGYLTFCPNAGRWHDLKA